MADEITAKTDFIALGMKSADPALLTKADGEVSIAPAEPAPRTAPERLRAYEDDIFGKDAVRIRGQVERGYGSKFKVMPADQARHHAALERLVLTEQALADAEAALLAAKASHEAAVSAAAASEPGSHAG